MAKLIEEFLADHKALIAFLDEARRAKDLKALRQALARARSVLLSHLHKEDAEFSPVLEKAAKSDVRLQVILGLFIEDIAAVTRQFIAFYELLDTETPAEQLMSEFDSVSALLRKRIFREESYLYPEFERLGLG